ncbi:phosphatidylinositol-4,5-bisphosphate 3-kinase catalytic subunit alpha/beta/delta [Paragonimus westermani]|uniref:Phosphatidylinositol-4,5-bisphosphate 3-kinase catalytic subunit alpha/beta/delta n=1 Tax=Paragonimus westermani TaxID=34504 RepID=A0A5J4NRR6_9TREM|nr:phosphatidylinositol-4,5-bisphosphate 3-kinase catalytic subunit alpha/beta/delta [Paragonimus westermani]
MSPTPGLQRGFSLLIDSSAQLDFLLPNGLMLPLELDSELCLSKVKDELWFAAAREPMFDKLQSKDRYIFSGINRETAEEQEYYDQTLRLRELPLLLPYLRVIETTKDSELLERNMQDATIASCIGISHADITQAERLIPEVKWARTRLCHLATMHRQALRATGSNGLAQYLASATQRHLSKSLLQALNNLPNLTICAWILDGEESGKERRVSVELNVNATVRDALNELLQIQTDLFRNRSPSTLLAFPVIFRPLEASAYVLKICCSQSYLFELDAKLVSFEYVQSCIEQAQHPCLSPVLRKDVCETLANSLNDDSTSDLICPLRPCCQSEIEHSSPLLRNTHLSSRLVTSNTDHSPHASRNTSSIETTDLRESSPYRALEELLCNNDEKHEKDESDVIEVGDDCADLTSKLQDKEQAVTSVWNLSYYLSVQVRSAKFLVGTLSSTQATAPGSPSTQQHSSLASVFAACLDVSQSSYVVRVGLFHGTQSLIEYQTTSEMPGSHMSWNKWLNFHVLLANIPPAARLCVALIKLERNADKRAGKTYEYPVGWANLNFFDHRGFMRSGEVTLRLWPASLLQSTEERFNRLYPAGTVLENPNPDFTLQIRIHNPTGRRIRLPSFRSFIEAHCRQNSWDSTAYNSLSKHSHPQLGQELRSDIPPNGMAFVNQVFGSGDMEEDLDESMLNVINPERDLSSPLFHPDYSGLSTEQDNNETLLREMVSHDPLYELSEQEKCALWRNRYFCMKNFPEALPWLTQSVCWYRRESLMEFYYLLHSWPRPLNARVALQLLGAMGLNASMVGEANAVITSAASQGARGGASGIPDAYVRELAVNSLYDLSDAELGDYLLQLVQALKAEAYLDNCLSRFILFRALRNPLLIGLRLFWHLRSEIHLPDMYLKFGLLLEAFCLGCGPLLTFLARQVTALNRLESISARVKELTNEDEQRSRFREEIARPEARRDLEWLPSPLCLTERLGRLIIDKCDVKRSKKRPLWIVWSNSDRLATHHHAYYQLIFKHGDDLRQDMLTLQILRVMDRIWKNEGMDMCLVPYGCLATGPEMGLIEAVRNARTVMSIQGERLRAALQIDNTQLFKWLTQHINKTRDPNSSSENGAYERLIRNFTMSCAGYCVATFVLGIRDRHPDNIMVDTSGRLFHIDFGHILDNRKKKFGITRERVPFVLTKDFITVIAHGNPDVVLGAPVTDTGGGGSRNRHFQEFTQLCGRAYLLLRKHANLLLTLFAMMLPSGLPELTSVCDLEYVRKTLAVDLSEEQALAYFHGKFNEAYYGAWTTKIDWFGHWMNT